MNKLIIDIHYFPGVIFYKKAINFSHIIFDQYEHYEKMSFRNRCVLAGSNGPVTLSIPLEGGRNQRAPVKEVRIDNRQNWQRHQWTTITSCYNRSPWFDFYRPGLEALYSRKPSFLLEWNLNCFEWMRECLGLSWELSLTTSYQPVYDPAEVADWRNRFTPAALQNSFPDPPRYRQVFEERLGFLPHLSILDLLCCTGRGAADILKAKS